MPAATATAGLGNSSVALSTTVGGNGEQKPNCQITFSMTRGLLSACVAWFVSPQLYVNNICIPSSPTGTLQDRKIVFVRPKNDISPTTWSSMGNKDPMKEVALWPGCPINYSQTIRIQSSQTQSVCSHANGHIRSQVQRPSMWAGHWLLRLKWATECSVPRKQSEFSHTSKCQ